MKKHSFIAVLAALVLAPALNAQVIEPLSAQDSLAVVEYNNAQAQKKEAKKAEKKEKKVKKYGFLNHWGVGASVGVDGVNGELAVCLGNNLQLRAGVNMLTDDLPYISNYLPYEESFDLGSYKIGATERNLDDIKISASGRLQAYHAMVDLYLTKRSTFHLTAGVYGNDFWGNEEIAHATADISKVLTPAELAGNPKVSIELSDPDTGKKVLATYDEKGLMHVGIRPSAYDTFRPYFGIGWGRIANIRQFINLSLELGVMKSGLEVTIMDKDGIMQPITSGMLKDGDGKYRDVLPDNIPVAGNLVGDQPLINYLATEGIYKGWLPIAKLGLSIRLF